MYSTALQPNADFSTGLTVWSDIAREQTTESRVIPLSANTAHHSRHFIEANTKPVDIEHLREDCIVPVFSKDNELTISHQAFIETVLSAAYRIFPNEAIDTPDIVASHIIKGRIPEAIHKPASQLLDSDKTIYYERMAFCFEIPTIYEDIAGNRLNLSIGGVRAYNHENLYSRKTMERFKIFIGFKNLVCCNLCVSTDGLQSDMRVMSAQQLFEGALQLFRQYNAQKHLSAMSQLQNLSLSEHQFAQLIGKTRLYQYLPAKEKKQLPTMEFTDSHINAIARAYYADENFSRTEGADEIDLWRVYNLFTGANKSSYIDTFLDRSLNATELVSGIGQALQGDSRYSWFIE